MNSYAVRSAKQSACKGTTAAKLPTAQAADDASSPEAAGVEVNGNSIGARVVTFLCDMNLPSFPPECSQAITAFWKSRPSKEPVQHPYKDLASFLDEHLQGSGLETWGYDAVGDLLQDAQAAGLVWLRPGTVRDADTGKPLPEIAAAANGDISNPAHVLYWLALGFLQEEAKRCKQLALHRAWTDDVVGKLAKNSPSFDKQLHAGWYFDHAGRRSWAVRQMMKQAEAAAGSPVTATGDLSACLSPGSTPTLAEEGHEASGADGGQDDPGSAVPSLTADRARADQDLDATVVGARASSENVPADQRGGKARRHKSKTNGAEKGCIIS